MTVREEEEFSFHMFGLDSNVQMPMIYYKPELNGEGNQENFQEKQDKDEISQQQLIGQLTSHLSDFCNKNGVSEEQIWDISLKETQNSEEKIVNIQFARFLSYKVTHLELLLAIFNRKMNDLKEKFISSGRIEKMAGKLLEGDNALAGSFNFEPEFIKIAFDSDLSKRASSPTPLRKIDMLKLEQVFFKNFIAFFSQNSF